jgi:hypothetical protein
MTDDRDQKLDNLLGARRVEPPSPEFPCGSGCGNCLPSFTSPTPAMF